MRLDDHPVHHAHQRVVGLLDRRFLAFEGADFLFERLEQLAGAEVEFQGLRRVVYRRHGVRRADLPVGLLEDLVEIAALREHRDHLRLGDELEVVDGRMVARRVVERRDQPSARHHQRHHLQAQRRALADPAQRLRGGRKALEVHQRVAHLVGQGDLQVGPADEAHAHERLAQRHAAVSLLLEQTCLQLRVRDHAEGGQRLPDADKGHAALRVEVGQQRLGRGNFGREHGWARAALRPAVARVAKRHACLSAAKQLS